MKTKYYIASGEHRAVDVWLQHTDATDTLELTFNDDDTVEGVCDAFASYLNGLSKGN